MGWVDGPGRVQHPGWVEHSIWWHVYPLGFGGAPIRDADPQHTPRLRRLFNWLDYAVALGASGLQLGPVFDSGSHGYDSIDQFHIDPRLGTDDDFDELVARCRERGLRVLLDGVFNHVGVEHPLFVNAMREGRDSAAAAMFAVDWDAPGGPKPRVFEGHGALVELDHRSPAAADYVTKVLDHWLDRGIDGWRLDAAYAVDPAFWARVLPGVRERHPDAWFVGEMLHGDYADYVARSSLDSVTQYELWKAIWSSLADRNFFELDWTLSRHNEFTAAFTPTTFVGNHDVTRIASIVGPDGAVLALTILMTVAGIPSIYYGDEQGYVGVKEERIGGDDAVRPEFPERPDELADWGAEILRAHQDLIGLRRRHPWLVRARTEQVSLTNTHYAYRAFSGDDAIEVDVDVEDSPRAVVRSGNGEVLWQFGV